MERASSPLISLTTGVVYAGTGYPFVAGSFFVVLFGSSSQRELDALKKRFGKPTVVGFFPQFESFFEWVLKDDPSAKMFEATLQFPPQPRPDPASDLPAFVAALHKAGMLPGQPFSARLLLDRLVTPAVRKRAYAFLNHANGVGTSDRFEKVLTQIVIDATKIA